MNKYLLLSFGGILGRIFQVLGGSSDKRAPIVAIVLMYGPILSSTLIEYISSTRKETLNFLDEFNEFLLGMMMQIIGLYIFFYCFLYRFLYCRVPSNMFFIEKAIWVVGQSFCFWVVVFLPFFIILAIKLKY